MKKKTIIDKVPSYKHFLTRSSNKLFAEQKVWIVNVLRYIVLFLSSVLCTIFTKINTVLCAVFSFFTVLAG